MQRRAVRPGADDYAVERLLVRLSEFAEETVIFANHRHVFVPSLGAQPSGPSRPVGYSVSIAFEILSMRAQGKAREDVENISTVCNDVRNARSPSDASTASGILTGVVSEWRMGPLDNLPDRFAMIRSVARGAVDADIDDEEDAA